MMHYTGGKGRMLPYILPLLSDSKVYVEPFFGSGAVFFAKKPSSIEVINDKDSIIYAIFKTLQNREMAADLHRRLRLSIISRRFFVEAVDILNRYRRGEDIPLVDVAYAALYYNRFTVKKSFLCVSQNEFRPTLTFWKNLGFGKHHMMKVFWHCVRRLRRAIIMCDDALSVMERFDSKDTLFYLDPPYITQSKHYAHDIDHEALVGFLLNMRGKAILSCHYHEVYEPLLANGWEMRTFKMRFDNFQFQECNRERKETLLISPNLSIRSLPDQPTLF